VLPCRSPSTQLVLEAAAEDFDSLAHVEDLLARHWSGSGPNASWW
jgi:hypothetical protein